MKFMRFSFDRITGLPNAVCLVLFVILETGCLKENVSHIKVSPCFSPGDMNETEEIRNYNILFYNSEGILASYHYITDLRQKISIPVGQEYSVYAVANVGNILDDAGLREERYLKEYLYRLSEEEKGLPLTYYSGGTIMTEDMEQLHIRFQRSYAKIKISVDTTALSDFVSFSLASIDLFNNPSSIMLFSENRPTSVSDLSHSRICDDPNILKSAYNEGITFNMFENLQGELLAGNKDESKKHFPPGSPLGKLCSFIEIRVKYSSLKYKCDSLKYRFYLGENNTSNFDIHRNTSYHYTLAPTGDGISECSWRVDTAGFIKNPEIDPDIVNISSDTVNIVNDCFAGEYAGSISTLNKIRYTNSSGVPLRWEVKRSKGGIHNVRISPSGTITHGPYDCGEFQIRCYMEDILVNKDPVILNIYTIVLYQVGMSVGDITLSENGKSISAVIAQWTALRHDQPEIYELFLKRSVPPLKIVRRTVVDQKCFKMGEAFLSVHKVEGIPLSGTPEESCYRNIPPFCELYNSKSKKSGKELDFAFSETPEGYYLIFKCLPGYIFDPTKKSEKSHQKNAIFFW